MVIFSSIKDGLKSSTELSTLFSNKPKALLDNPIILNSESMVESLNALLVNEVLFTVKGLNELGSSTTLLK